MVIQLPHPLEVCTRVEGRRRYHNGNWSQLFRCWYCRAEQWQNTNWLGNKREMYCDGDRMYKRVATREDWLKARRQ